MSVTKRRRAVYTALSKFLKGDDLLEVLVHWEKCFADKPSFALNSFISSFVDKCHPSVSRSVLIRELTYQLMQPEGHLLADPGVVSLNRTVRALGQDSLDNDRVRYQAVHYRVFTHLMQGMLLNVNYEIQTQIRMNLIKKLSQLSLDNESVNALEDWFADNKKLYLETVEVSVLKELLNYFYIEMCELLGPVEADRLLASHARYVHETEDGGIFTPYYFL